MVETKISTIVIAMLFISAIVVGMSNFYMGLHDVYKTGDTGLTDLEYINQTDYLVERSGAADQKLDSPFTGIPVIGGIIDFFYQGMISVWNAMTIMTSTMNATYYMVEETGETVLMPDWFINFIIALISIIIVIALIAVITKREV